MPLELHVQVEGLDRVKQIFKQYPDEIAVTSRGLIKELGSEAIREGQNQLKPGGPGYATGRMRGSFWLDVRSDFEAEVYPNVGYSGYVEKGTRPHFPPVEAIFRWVRIKFGLAEKAARQAAWAIAVAMSKRGTKGTFFMEVVFVKMKTIAPKAIDKAMSKLFDRTKQ